jgi:integrase
MSFTSDGIKSLEKGQTAWDRGSQVSVKGLHAKATGTGVSFMLYYRTKQGLQRRPKIGDFPAITVGEARKRAKVILDQVATGIDPKGEWDLSKAETTVADLYKKTFDEYWDTPKFRNSRRTQDVVACWKRLEPYFAKMKLSQVSVPSVISWQKSQAKTPFAANRALEVLSRMFRYAEELGFRSPGSNPCSAVSHFPEKSRDRYPSAEELRKIKMIFDRDISTNPRAVVFLYLLAVTGSRPSAIERAKWSDIKTVTNPAGEQFGILVFSGKSTDKTGNNEVVVIPPQGMRMLERLPRLGNSTITGIKMPRRYWLSVREEIGSNDLWARDLRRGFATVGLSGGMNLSTIGELLNHSSTQTTKTYAKLMDAPRMAAAQAVANQMDRIMTGGNTETH